MVKKDGSAKKVSNLFKNIKKRDGKVVTFDIKRISNAVYKAMIASHEGDEFDSMRIAEKVALHLSKMHIKGEGLYSQR